MNYKEDDNNKIPFYMTYPMQNMYLAEMEYEKDMERMKELYPREVRRIQEMIEKHCDEMEHEASRMYDENPDRQMMEEEARRLYERFLRENPQYNAMMAPPPMHRPIPPRPMPRMEGMMEVREDIRMQQYGVEYDDKWLRSLIHIMFHDEVYRRRCRNRRCRRWW